MTTCLTNLINLINLTNLINLINLTNPINLTNLITYFILNTAVNVCIGLLEYGSIMNA
jgi:hypothetical protein